jgi:hypothetical protein
MVAPHPAPLVTDAGTALSELAATPVRVVDYDSPDATGRMVRLSGSGSDDLTAELDGAVRWLGVAPDEVLLTALCRTIGRTLGEGVVRVDVASQRGSMLAGVPLVCATSERADITELLHRVHRALADYPASAAHAPATGVVQVYLNYLGEVPETAVPVPVQDSPPGLGHVLELRVYRTADGVHVDWWYDADRYEPYTVEELADQFVLALYEVTSDALPPR